MARHEHLPIDQLTLELSACHEKVVAGFSRYRKYTLGTELRLGSRGERRVVRANYPTSCVRSSPA